MTAGKLDTVSPSTRHDTSTVIVWADADGCTSRIVFSVFAIVQSAIDLAHSLGLRMVAEGVEDEQTARQLCDAGCDEAVSVIICAYTLRRWNELVKAVASVEQQTRRPDETIIVIDHNSVLLERAHETFTSATVIPNRAGRGLSGARNTGVEAAGGEIVAFLDDDARAEPTWLAELLGVPVLYTTGAVVAFAIALVSALPHAAGRATMD